MQTLNSELVKTEILKYTRYWDFLITRFSKNILPRTFELLHENTIQYLML